MLSLEFAPVGFADLPDCLEDDQLAAFEAFRRFAFHVLTRSYRDRGLGIIFDTFGPAYAEVREQPASNSADARDFFERHFQPALVPSEGRERDFVTGFYEPDVEAFPVYIETFRVPLLSRSADLIDIDDQNCSAGMGPYLVFAQQTPKGLFEYFDRTAIERGGLSSKRLEIVWLAIRSMRSLSMSRVRRD